MCEWYRDPQTVNIIYCLAISNGIIKKISPDVPEASKAGMVRVMVTPSPYPLDQYSLALEVQPEFNSLVDAISCRHEFLSSALEKVLETDTFTRRLFDIYQQTRHDNKQTCVLGIYRCDYMLDWNGDGSMGLRQIEINTVACGMLSFGQRLKSFYEYVCSRYAENEACNVPENVSLEGTVDAIAMAWKEFDNKEAVVLFVVDQTELNMYGQLAVEFDLWKRYSIKCVRKTLSQLYSEAILSPDRQLILSNVPCAVVYFRSGYSPTQYPTEKEWEARLLMEKSTASLCPSVADQLVGTKKIQQCLAVPGTLEQFVSDPKLVEKMRSTFAGQYSLDKTPEGDRAVELALQDPNRFVLKPQREGGGNNYYGNDVRVKMEEIRNTSERGAYILMDRVRPPPQMGLVLKSDPRVLELEREPVISELGIFGTYVRRGERVLLNKAAGNCLRTKLEGVNEGGVSYGASALDAPSLVSTEEFIRRLKSS